MGLEDDLYGLLESRRRQLGLSQAEVSQRAFGRNDSSLMQNMRRGKNGPTVRNLAAACRALDLEIDIRPKGAARPAENAIVPGFAEAPSVFTMDRRDQQHGRGSMSETPPGGEAFYFQTRFDICDRLLIGWHGLVEPAADVFIGDLVWAEDKAGEVLVFLLEGESDKVPDGMLVDTLAFGDEVESWSRGDFVRMHPVTWTGRTPPLIGDVQSSGETEERRNAAVELGRIVAELQELQSTMGRAMLPSSEGRKP